MCLCPLHIRLLLQSPCLILITLLVERQTDNPSPGAVIGGKLDPRSHKRGELRYTIVI